MLRPPILLLLAISCVLLAFGCATTRTEPRPTTPDALSPAEAAETAEATRLAAELEASLANPPPAVPEPTPPEPIWDGYMVVETGNVPPSVAILFPEEGGLITQQTLDEGVRLNAATASSGDAYWLFPVTRGALLFRTVRVYDDGHVAVEAPIRTKNGAATIIVAASTLDDPSGMASYRPCARGVCGHLQKAVANRIVGCEGSGCADLMAPTP